MGAHTTTDDPTRYRLNDELEHWKLKDPIERLKVYLRRNGLADQEFFDSLDAEAEELGAHLREGCKALPDPKPLDHLRLGVQRDDRGARGPARRVRGLPRELR